MTGPCISLSRLLLISLVLVGWAAVCTAATITIRADGTGDYPTIADAIYYSSPGDEIVLEPGIHQGCTDYMGKAVTIRSTNPEDPAVVAATMIWDGVCLSFFEREGRDSVLAGVTLFGGVGVAVSDGASPTIRNCIFDGDGEGIRIYFGDPLIQNCIFRVTTTAIAVFNGAPTIDACTISDTSKAIDCQEGNATVSRCTIVNNHAAYMAAVAVIGGHLTLRDSLIRNNTIINSPVGPCVLGLYGGSLTVEGCTIVGNEGGFARVPDGQTIIAPHGPLVLCNTILWGNPGGPPLPDPAASTAPIDVSYSLIEGGCAGTGILNVDPMLLPNGGLSPNSPCINAGDPGFVPAAGELDLDGHPRVIASRIDIGADEFARSGDVNADGSVDVVDLLYLVDSWALSFGEPAYDPRCDFDGNGRVDVVDLLIFVENWD